jgi:hypothetical protein
MSWINKNKSRLRAMMLGLLLIALIGPWVFDIIHVPGEFPCSAPWIRLVDNFCGERLSGIWILSGITGAVAGLFNGPPVSEVLRSFIFPIPLLLPIISTSILLLRRDQGRWLVFHLIALILSISVIGLSGLLSYPRFSWVVWGVWLYVGVAATALILEGAFLATKARPDQP